MKNTVIGYFFIALFSFFFFSGFFYVVTSIHAEGQYASVMIESSNDRLSGQGLLDVEKYTMPNLTPSEAPIFGSDIFLPKITTTPIPTAAPKIEHAAFPMPNSAELDVLFSKYSSEYGVDIELMKKIARCESGFNNNADTGIYGGMFQYLASTWSSTRRSIGLDPDTNLRFNAEESIKTAAYMLSQGRQNAWPVCSR